MPDMDSRKLNSLEEEVSKVLTISDIKAIATKKLAPMYRDYYNDGSMDMISMQDNEAAFDRYKLRPRILVDVSTIDTSTTIFGKKVAFPLGFAPAAMHRLAHPDGEVATSRAAAKANIAMGLSSYATASIEEVGAEAKLNPYFMQLSILDDREKTLRMIRRVEAAGFSAIFITVDAPLLGRRLNEFRNRFTLPEQYGFPNLYDNDEDGAVQVNNGFSRHRPKDVDPEQGMKGLVHVGRAHGLRWDDVVPWLRRNTKLEVWLKGVYTPEDVQLAIRYGVDGVVISNHGGRQLDGVPATLDALRECAPVAAGRIQIAIDGGIRRGSDIFKALALGAQHCFVGRVPIWSLAYNGQDGVDRAIEILMDEFRLVMGLTGCAKVQDISPNHLSVLNFNGMLCKL
ncbi:hypothetical protein F4677DRAFT_452864 [Hypoxylon crocopeplum]|nr:hypothetical protein F4677DRAFT_452864 [Hypoxylon crocopeplum]